MTPEQRQKLTEARIVWLDLETTGLDPLRDDLLEVGVIITDGLLREIDRAEWTLKATPEKIATMPPVVIAMHAESGLTARCLASPLEAYEIDVALYAFLAKNGVTNKSFLAGNSVGDFDRHFMRRHLPGSNAAISHRSINVSTFKALFSLWAPDVAAPKLERVKAHRALLDCEAAIAELSYWLDACEHVPGIYGRKGGLPGWREVSDALDLDNACRSEHGHE